MNKNDICLLAVVLCAGTISSALGDVRNGQTADDQRLFTPTLVFAQVVGAPPTPAGEDSATVVPQNANLAFHGYGVEAQAGEKKARKLNDNDVSGESEVSVAGMPATFHLRFPRQTRVDAVRIYPGNVDYANNASGECSPVSYVAEGLSSASGMWRELVRVKDAPNSRQLRTGSNQEYFVEHRFNPLDLTELRVVVTDSNDTQQRFGGVSVDQKSTILREIEVYDTQAVNVPRNFLSETVQGDYRLPVYRNSRTAELYLVCSESIQKPLRLQISFSERTTQKVPALPLAAEIVAGQNVIPIDIGTWENGEYRTSIRAASEDGSVVGEFGRLLRIDNMTPPTPPAGVTAMDGEKMFFPDDWYLEAKEGVEFTTFSAKVYRATSDTPKKMINIGTGIRFAEQNRLVIPFYSKNRDWSADSIEGHYATAELGNLENWTTTDNLTETLLPAQSVYPPLTVFPEAVPEWKPRDGQRVTYRFYDRAKDGKLPLDQLFMLYSHEPRDMGIIYAPPQTTWVAWKKGQDEIVLLEKKFFLQDNISGDEFESPTDSNDNLAGQWLSADGQTFCYVRGRLLRRFPPFIARYDNLWQVSRVLTVFSTHDGFNWTRHYFGLPTSADPFGSQHYGASIVRLPAAKGLMISFTLNYDVQAQQFCVEVYYSWGDGSFWQRFPGQPVLVPNGPQGSWTAGCINIYQDAIQRDGTVYHLIGWSGSGPHFSGEVTHSTERIVKLDGAYLEKLFGQRDLESWPYFRQYGSWQTLADSLKKTYIATGLAVYREDGWFGLSAQNGTFTTRAVTASGTMSANARIDQGGEIRLTLVDADGAEMPGYSAVLTGDSVNMPISFAQGPHLPEVPFRIRATLRDAVLFCFRF